MKGLTKLLAVVLLLLAMGTWSLISTVHAHEFIIKPASLRVNARDKVPLERSFDPRFHERRRVTSRQHRQSIVA